MRTWLCTAQYMMVTLYGPIYVKDADKNLNLHFMVIIITDMVKDMKSTYSGCVESVTLKYTAFPLPLKHENCTNRYKNRHLRHP